MVDAIPDFRVSDGTGPVTIDALSLPLPNGASTEAKQDSQISSLQILDDVPSGMNAAFNKANPIAGHLDDVSTTAATENNVAPVRITAQRALHANLRDSAGTELLGQKPSSGSIPVVFSSDISAIPIQRSWNSKLRYVDMNASSGGIARGSAVTTSWTDVFSYSGSGYISGFIINLETFTLWKIRFIVDGEEIFDSAGITSDDLIGNAIYDMDDVADVNQSYLGLSKGSNDRFVFSSPSIQNIKYNSSVVIKVARVSGGTKKFQAGLIVLSKDT
jgi:hypothetical protein